MVETAPWPIPKKGNLGLRVVWVGGEKKREPTYAEYEEECEADSSGCDSHTDSSDDSDDEDVALDKAVRRKAARQMSDCGLDLPAFSRLFTSWKSRSEKPDFHDLRNVVWKAIVKNHIGIVLYLLQGGYCISFWEVVHATRLHRFELLEAILDGGWWDINQMPRPLTPPLLSVVVEDEVCVQWLLDHGADPNGRCTINLTVLSHAVSFASLSTIQLILDDGGDVTKGELLHHALLRDDEIEETVRLLLDAGAPIDCNMYEDDEAGYRRYAMMSCTPLHKAVEEGMLDIVKLLVERGADLNKLDKRYENGKRFTALELAARARNWDAYFILAPLYKIDISSE